jgi:acyl-CoA synthetase (AMP-forming)/AMP-acid ligase II
MTEGCDKLATLRAIPELLDSLAEQCGDSVAIAAPGRVPLRYSRLRLQLTETGETLAGMGIGGNDRVALVVPNGPEMAVAFASVSSFAICAPLNPTYKFNEFDFYLSI